MAFSDSEIEAVALRVAELLRGGRASGELVDAAEIARQFSVSRDFVYSHAKELGAVRPGAGPRARLRFDPTRVASYLKAPASESGEMERHHRPRTKHRSTSLLPVHGRTSR